MLPCWVPVTITVFVCVFILTLVIGLFLKSKIGDAAIAMLQKLSYQRTMYRRALKRAKALSRPLLVIGDPRAPGTMNARFRGYKCGHICVDLKGCTKCPKGTQVLKMDLVDALRNMKDKSVVIFESETLDYLPENMMNKAVKEMKRVSGGEIFSVHFVGQRTRLLTKQYQTNWTPKRVIVFYPPSHPDFVWLETDKPASWQCEKETT
jgi:hypothetical protein